MGVVSHVCIKYTTNLHDPDSILHQGVKDIYIRQLGTDKKWTIYNKGKMTVNEGEMMRISLVDKYLTKFELQIVINGKTLTKLTINDRISNTTTKRQKILFDGNLAPYINISEIYLEHKINAGGVDSLLGYGPLEFEIMNNLNHVTYFDKMIMGYNHNQIEKAMFTDEKPLYVDVLEIKSISTNKTTVYVYYRLVRHPYDEMVNRSFSGVSLNNE